MASPGGSALLLLDAARMRGSSRNCIIFENGERFSRSPLSTSCLVGKSGWCARICKVNEDTFCQLNVGETLQGKLEVSVHRYIE